VITVFDTRKVPRDRLLRQDAVPDEFDSVPVRVLAIGEVSAQERNV
jgi:hypothetical protein